MGDPYSDFARWPDKDTFAALWQQWQKDKGNNTSSDDGVSPDGGGGTDNSGTPSVSTIGPQGLQGVEGKQGIQGIPGSRGLRGLKGETGDQGPIGPRGLTSNSTIQMHLSDAYRGGVARELGALTDMTLSPSLSWAGYDHHGQQITIQGYIIDGFEVERNGRTNTFDRQGGDPLVVDESAEDDHSDETAAEDPLHNMPNPPDPGGGGESKVGTDVPTGVNVKTQGESSKLDSDFVILSGSKIGYSVLPPGYTPGLQYLTMAKVGFQAGLNVYSKRVDFAEFRRGSARLYPLRAAHVFAPIYMTQSEYNKYPSVGGSKQYYAEVTQGVVHDFVQFVPVAK